MGLWSFYKLSGGSIRTQAYGAAGVYQAFKGFYKDPGLWGCGVSLQRILRVLYGSRLMGCGASTKHCKGSKGVLP